MNSGDYIPFLNSKGDCELFKKFYADAKLCRIPIDRLDYTVEVPADQCWVDTGFDGLSEPLDSGRSDKWKEFVRQLGEVDFLLDSVFLEKPNEAKLRPLVTKLLDIAWARKPGYLSVPQFPHADGITNNKINRMLAALASEWRTKSCAKAKFILPIIFTHQRQLVGKTERGPKVKLAASLITRAGAEGYWSVDCSLDDQKGIGNFDKERFPAVISFFEELNQLLTCPLRIAGPYWGLNLVLWARGLATHFAVGLGSTYNHHVTGGFSRKTKARVAIASLRRWVIANNELSVWLGHAIAKLPAGSTEARELDALRLTLDRLQHGDAGKRQIAEVYRNWVTKIEAVAPTGRALALYQDLSTAFVTGRNLPELPSDEGTARRPERVAQQLMLNCL